MACLIGFLKVRRIRGPRKTIESVKEIPEAFGGGADKKAVAAGTGSSTATNGKQPATTDPSGW